MKVKDKGKEMTNDKWQMTNGELDIRHWSLAIKYKLNKTNDMLHTTYYLQNKKGDL